MLPGFTHQRMIRATASTTWLAARAPSGEDVVLAVAEGASGEQLVVEHAILGELTGVQGISRPLGLERRGPDTVLILDAPGDRDLAGAMATLDGPAALDLAVRLVQVVRDVHGQGIIHRALEPARILISGMPPRPCLFDFRSSRSRQHGRAVRRFEGTPAYMAPEQTGRVDREVDERADLYALGVILFEMFTGQRPFEHHSSGEVARAHLAERPRRADAITPALPAVMADIIERLLEKDPDHRYQTAHGLLADLRRVQAFWQAGGPVERFVPGRADRGRRLPPASCLHGRGAVLERLLARLAVQSGEPRLLCLVGEAGIGKSTVLRAVRQAVVATDGIVLAGKFDQFRALQPFSAFGEALDQLADQVLCAPIDAFERWRGALSAALGGLAAMIIDLAPRFGALLQRGEPTEAANPIEARNRVRLAVDRVIEVAQSMVSGRVVLLIDDMQWIDAGSTWLLDALLGGSSSLVVVAAARPVEPAPWSGLRGTLERRGGAPVIERLTPLSDAQIEALVADLTGVDIERARGLAAYIAAHSENNPLLARQRLTSLLEMGLIHLRPDGICDWDLDRIIGAELPETLAAPLDLLAEEPIRVLGLAACIGTSFDVALLRAITGLDAAVLEATLSDLRYQDLVTSGERCWRFAHDRIQEAAYHRLTPAERAAAHRQIGEHLLAMAGEGAIDAQVLAIVDQLNQGGAPSEPDRLAELNLTAGRRAIEQGAWQAAAAYLDAGLALVARHDGGAGTTGFELALERAQSALLLGAAEEADERFRALLAVAGADATARMRIRARQVMLLAARARFDEAMQTGLTALAEADVRLPRRPGMARIVFEFGRALWLTRPGRLEAFLQAAPADRISEIVLRLLPALASAAYALDKTLLVLLLSRGVTEVAARGESPSAANALANFAVALVGMGRVEHGLAVYDIAQRMAARLPPRHRVRVDYITWLFGRPWNTPLADCIPPLRIARPHALEAGDVEYALLHTTALHSLVFLSGGDLRAFYEETRRDLALYGPYGVGAPVAHSLSFIERAVGQLIGLYALPEADPFAFDTFPADAADAIVYNLPLALPLLCVFGRFEQVVVEGRRLPAPLSQCYFGVFYEAVLRFYLAFAALCGAEDTPRAEVIRGAREARRWLRPRAERCPANFQQWVLTLDAELDRAAGQADEAQAGYTRAAEAAHRHGDRIVHGLIEERRASLYAAHGMSHAAQSHLRAARAIYAAWGARAKVDAMDAAEALPRSLAAPSGERRRLALREARPALVWEIARRLAGALALESVVRSVLEVAVEQAEATYGLLALEEDDGVLRAVGEHTIGGEHHALDEPLATRGDAPVRLMQTVARTREAVVIASPNDAGASGDGRLTRSPAISALCLPLTSDDALAGVLYLENHLVAGAFSRALAAEMADLAGQAAISLTNARRHETSHRLLETLRAQLAQRSAELDAAREEALEGVKAKATFLAAMSHELRTPMNGLMGMAQLLAATPLTSEQEDHAQAIVHSADALLAVLDDILDFSRIEVDEFVLEAAPLSLRAVVDEVRGRVADAALRKALAVVVEVAEDVHDEVMGDARRLRQVLHKVAANAVKFTDAGEVRLTVTHSGPIVRFDVVDTGIGIPRERLDRLFRSFAQGDESMSRRFGGTGLGLATCVRLVERMGGRIQVESEPGQGSTFRIELPLAPLASVAPAPRATAPGVARVGRVLVAEDNPINQKITVRMLERAGHACMVADDGLQALEAEAGERFDLILMDCQMPGLDGLEATRRLRARGCRLPIIALTAGVMPEERQACFEAGMDGFLPKPVKATTLLETVDACLHGSSSAMGAGGRSM